MRIQYLIPSLILSVVLAMSAAWAQEIRLTDKTSLTADVLQRDDEGVVVRLPRSAVATVDGTPLPPALVAGVAAPTFAVSDLAGTPQSLNTTTGKATLLHFWVSWCPHCQSDAAKIQALYEQFQHHPTFQLITVNLEPERAPVDKFVQERKATYPIVLASEQAAKGVDLPRLYDVNQFPVTFLIDEQGVIRRKTIGSFAEQNVDMAAVIREMLPEPPAGLAEAKAPRSVADAAALPPAGGAQACDCSKVCSEQAKAQ